MRFSTSSSSEMPKISSMIRVPMQIFTGVLGLDAFAEYKTENGFLSIAWKMSSAKVFAQECSNAFCSLAVSQSVQSVKDIY